MKTTMYRQGSGWIISRWDESVQAYRLSNEVSYWSARHACGEDNCPGAHGGTCRVASHDHTDDGGENGLEP